ncbi:Oidioi.mRNA.OKI2018_I69.chr2.g4366.t1.cds [Oikopleura dioica]|uniref:Oidioi.mRNA.OKI2018_I69.chr2.g4366.t1.cds n=1 Tax=Oikopleura dioica TaxID=34765 RepID=A0ABN7T2N9_OIKDI|nr:Oidioi.mRNA.OKI2018_I69.chr2.g4366.t1.cds [Oikopleura dioica]
MQRLLSAAILVKISQIDAATVDTIAHKLNMQWDLSNNCGPRPSWLKLDPPSVSTGHYSDNLLCDILDDHLYIPGYSCSGTCPDGLQRAEIICDCHSAKG